MKLKNRISLSGLILGSVFGLAGLLTGLYMGIFKSLYESGGLEKLPPEAIMVAAVLFLVFVAACGYVLRLYLTQQMQIRRGGN